jgi:hypothetical protein
MNENSIKKKGIKKTAILMDRGLFYLVERELHRCVKF